MDPVFAAIYGEIKSGKSADSVVTFGRRAVYFAAPGALASAQTLWGFELPKRAVIDLETFADITEFCLKELKPGDGCLGVVIDDATLIADRTVAKITREYTGDNRFEPWARFLRQIVRHRDAMRRLRKHVIINCHSTPPEIRNGVRIKGGPAFPGQARFKIPAAFDLLLRTEMRAGAGNGPETRTALGWGYCYRTAPSSDWYAGSRLHACAPDYCPMNLGEILRLGGYVIPRPAGLEWQEKVIAGVAAALEPVLTQPAAVASLFDQTMTGCLKRDPSELHALWAWRDAYDRAVLRIAQRAARRALWSFS